MKKWLLIWLWIPLSASAQVANVAEVMMMGTFHFSSPGNDSVKTQNIDVMTPESRAYLERLVKEIATDFLPTRVLLEYSPESEARIQKRYQQYLAGDYELGVNEIYQIGFRLAKASGLTKVHSFDHRDVPWAAEPMLDYAKSHEPEAHAAFETAIADITRRMQAQQSSMTLPELLVLNNQPSNWQKNKALYIATNEIGAGVNFTGADASASWWQRNFRMYALIQQAAADGERVFVLGGTGHIAILADLLALDGRRRGRPVLPLIIEAER